jgi:hypothetical protein
LQFYMLTLIPLGLITLYGYYIYLNKSLCSKREISDKIHTVLLGSVNFKL